MLDWARQKEKFINRKSSGELVLLKKIRISENLLENLYGWLGAQGKFMILKKTRVGMLARYNTGAWARQTNANHVWESRAGVFFF